MKLLLVAALAALAGVGAAPGATAAADRTVVTPGVVRAIEATGAEVAYAAAARCVEVRVWDTSDRGNRRYGRHCFEQTSTGSGVAAVAVAGRRALWLAFTGGNVREWLLWTASRSAPRPRLLRFVARDVDAPSPIVLGSASDAALPYAVDRTVVVLRANGARAFAWEAPERVTALAAAGRGYAVTLAGGDVVTLNLRGEPVRRHSFAPERVRAAVLAGPGLLVHLDGRLLVRGASGDRSYPLPAGARFLGFASGIVAYASGRELRLLSLRDGADVRFRTLQHGFLAALDRRGLAYGEGRRVSWVGITRLAVALAR